MAETFRDSAVVDCLRYLSHRGDHGLPDELFKVFHLSANDLAGKLLQLHSAKMLTAAKTRVVRRGTTPVNIMSQTGDVACTLLEIADKHSVFAHG